MFLPSSKVRPQNLKLGWAEALANGKQTANTAQKIHLDIAAQLLNAHLPSCYNHIMETVIENRNASGQFTPGNSGNPGGRPKDGHRVADLARSYTTEAIETLVELMRHGRDDRVRGTAAQALLDRGWGKARQEIVQDISGPQESYLDVLKRVSEKIAARKED
jgi:hypothetical protein